jgi:hypothetical protein
VSDETVSDEKAGRRRVLVIAGLVVAVLVVAGVLTLMLTGGDDTADKAGEDTAEQTTATTPGNQEETGAPAEPATEAEVTAARGVAEQAAAAFAAGDVAAMTRISCDPEGGGTPVDIGENTTAELVGDPELSGDTGEIQLRISVGGTEPTVVPLPLQKRADGTWCVP